MIELLKLARSVPIDHTEIFRLRGRKVHRVHRSEKGCYISTYASLGAYVKRKQPIKDEYVELSGA